MMNLSDLCFLIGLGVTAVVAAKGGENFAYERIKQEKRDEEMEKLKEELAAMKRKMNYRST